MTEFVRKPWATAGTGLSRSTVYEMMERNEFPKPVKIGPRAVAWIASEIEAWKAQRIAERQNERTK